MTTTTTIAFATRFDTRDTEEGTEIRIFHKRSLIGRIAEDEIVLEDWEQKLQDFIASGDADFEAVEFFLTSGPEIEDDFEDGETGDAGSVVPAKYRVIYGAEQNCGDDIAIALTEFVTLPRAKKNCPDGGLDRSKLRAVAEVNGIGHKLANWEGNCLNGGLLRMNVSNVLRGMNRRGEEVRIGSRVWAADPSKMEERIAARKAARKAAREAAKRG